MRRETFVIFLGIVVTVGALVAIGIIFSHRQEVRRVTESIDVADSLAEEGDWEAVMETLTPHTEDPPTPELGEHIWSLMARAHQMQGEPAQAAAHWRRVAERGVNLRARGEALLALAEGVITSEGSLEEAQAYLQSFEELGVPAMSDRLALTRARLLLAQGEAEAARALLREAHERHSDSEEIGAIEDLLGELNLARLFSRQPQDDDTLYRIESGDTLDALGRRHGVSPSLLERINGLDPRRLRVGNRIKIPNTDFHIEVYKEDHMLYVFDAGEYFTRYPCRIGREEYMTPTETFTIAQRTVNPEWTTPDGRRIPAGDPENELGTRWMGFLEAPSIGIHGTIHPETIGTDASSGCIGLLTEDVEELFDLIPRGTEVRIYRSRSEAERGDRAVGGDAEDVGLEEESEETVG